MAFSHTFYLGYLFLGPSCGVGALLDFVTKSLVPSMEPDTRRHSKSICVIKS